MKLLLLPTKWKVPVKIKNILLIDSAEMQFKQGLNTLTGETGVGKSVLLDCLSFVLGLNNSIVVRDGANQGEVTAEFFT